MNLQDFKCAPEHVERMVSRRGWCPGPELRAQEIGKYSAFPYPKLHGLREMASLPLVDRLVTHAVVARIGDAIERTFSDRMYANRLATTGPEWALRAYPQAYGAYRIRRLISLAEHGWPFTCITDLRAFYPSIRRDLITADLRNCGADAEAVAVVGEQLAVWQERDRLHGLPVGDPAFGVLASAVLSPLDRALGEVAADRHAYSDDMTFFATSETGGEKALLVFQGTVAERGLELNQGKTSIYTDPASAIEAITNEDIDYLEVLAELMGAIDLDNLYALWDATLETGPIEEPRQVTNLHYALGRLGRVHDGYAVRGLIGRLDIMQLSPKHSVNYLLASAPDSSTVYEMMLAVIAQPVTPTNEALILHALRYLAKAPGTDALLAPCNRLLENQRAHPLTRAWAATAARRAPSWSCMATLERAETEPNFTIGRAELASTRGSVDHPHLRRHLLLAIAKERPDMAATCEWALRAA